MWVWALMRAGMMTPPLASMQWASGYLADAGCFLTYLHDLGALVGHRAVLVIALTLRVTGDESAVDDQCHDVSSFYNVSGK